MNDLRASPIADTATWFLGWLDDLIARGGAWSRESFAAAVGCEPCHISNLQAGRRGLSGEHALGVALAAELALEEAGLLLAVAARERVGEEDEDAVGQADEALARALEALRRREALGETAPPPVPPEAMGPMAGVLWHARGRPRALGPLAESLLPPVAARALQPWLDRPPVARWRSTDGQDPSGAQAAMLARIPWLVHRRSTRQQETRAVLWALPQVGAPQVVTALRELFDGPLEALSRRRSARRALVQVGAWMWPISEVVPPRPEARPWRPPASPQPAAAMGVPILAYDNPSAWLREVLRRWCTARKGRSVAEFSRKSGIPLSTLYAMTDPRRHFAPRHAPVLIGELGLGLDALDDLAMLLAVQGRGQIDVAARDRLAERRLSRGIIDPARDGWVAMTRLDWLTVLELAALPGFVADPAWIGRTVRPRQTEAEVITALSCLMKLGFLEADPDGVPRPTGQVLQTPDNLTLVQRARQQWASALQARVAVAAGIDPRLGGVEASYVSVPEEDLDEALAVVRKAYDVIEPILQQISSQNPPDQVFSLLLHGAQLSSTLQEQSSP